MIFGHILPGYIYFQFIHICKPKQVSVDLFHNKSWTRFEYDDPTSLRRPNFRDLWQSLTYYEEQNCANIYIGFTNSILKLYSLLSFFLVSTLLEKHTFLKKYISW